MSTEIQVPPRVFSKDYDDVSSLNSDVSLISSPRKSRMTKNSKFWRVYLPSIAIIFILTSAVVAYAMHSFFKRVPEPTVDVQGNSSPTAKNELVRRFDSTNGLSKRGSPLNSMEVGVYITCESRLDELLPFDFVNTQCSMCSKDFGIVSSRVMNLCIASQMITPIEKEVCKWPGMKCNEHGDIIDFMIKSSVAVDFIPSIEYLVAVESFSIEAVPSKPSRNILPQSLFTIKSLELVGVDVRVEFPAQMPQSKLSFLRLSNIRSLGVLPSWLSQLPMELFSLSNVTVGVPPSWFQGALWTDTIKRFELLDIQITRLPRFEFPTTTIVSIQ